VIYGCHAFIPRMKAQGGGHILNTASGAGLVSTLELAPYNLTKAAVVSLSQTLKQELAPYDIGVTVLCPSCVKTNIIEHTVDRLDVMEYTDGWGVEFIRTALRTSRITPEYEASRVIKALEKNKLYIKPRAIGFALGGLNARLTPESFYRIWAFMNKKGLAKPLFMKMAERGLL
jgi:short-subunit dehydrogenase